MKASTIIPFAAVVARQFSGVVAVASAPVQTPTALPLPNTRTSQGCFSNGGNLTYTPVTGMSSGKCNDACVAKHFWVTALHGSQCFCGFAYPPANDIVANSHCDYPCPNYPPEACGGLGDPGYWSVFNTGINVNVPNYQPPESSSTTSSTVQSQTAAPVTSSSAPAATTSSASKGSSTNVAAIAAGVVSGVVVVALIMGGIFFFMRRRRNAELEEEHRRNAAVNAFISGSKPPGSSGSISMTDSRLDPIMAHRRMSDGSIADNQDYSRRILRVTNA